MAISPARATAFEILSRVEREQSYATELLHSALTVELSRADHGLATEIVMGVLRWRSLLDTHLATASSLKLERLDLDVLIALRVGAYQLLFLSRIPARATIFESVELAKAARKRSAAPFVNAVLRQISKVQLVDPIAAILQVNDAEALAAASSHPSWLVKRWIERYGLPAARAICQYDQSLPSTSIRVRDTQTVKEIGDAGIEIAPGKLLTSARRVTLGDVTKTAAYQEGRVSIQDEGSQLVALLMGKAERILDCCAAPGGKTSLIAERNSNSLLVATEIHPHRARLLQRLARQPNVRVVAADARNLPLPAGFDRILADVPCSGTGTLARNPEIKWRLKADDFRELPSRQAAILRSALSVLRPGGRLVYSTCSLEREENEEVVEMAVAGGTHLKMVDCREELNVLQRSAELAVPTGSLASRRYLQTLPGVHPCDGFFAAMIERVM